MASKEPVYAPNDNARILEIPADLNVNRITMARLVQCLTLGLGGRTSSLVSSLNRAELYELRETLLVLGGCPFLEEILYKMGDYNPLVPAEDWKALYDWQIFAQAQHLQVYASDTKQFVQDGFSFASRIIEKNTNIALHHFRCRKSG